MNSLKPATVKLILLLAIGLSFHSRAFAAEDTSLQDNVIGSTFKTLAKGFVAVMDVDKFKKNNIVQLNKLRPDKYKRKYAKVYQIIRELPPELKIEYGIVEDMPREQLVREIELLDKKKIYEAINAIPNAIIGREFRLYLDGQKQEIRESSLVKQVNEFWNKVLAKVHGPMIKQH